MTLDEIMNSIHKEGVENEVFELLAQWFNRNSKFHTGSQVKGRGESPKPLNKI